MTHGATVVRTRSALCPGRCVDRTRQRGPSSTLDGMGTSEKSIIIRFDAESNIDGPELDALLETEAQKWVSEAGASRWQNAQPVSSSAIDGTRQQHQYRITLVFEGDTGTGDVGEGDFRPRNPDTGEVLPPGTAIEIDMDDLPPPMDGGYVDR